MNTTPVLTVVDDSPVIDRIADKVRTLAAVKPALVRLLEWQIDGNSSALTRKAARDGQPLSTQTEAPGRQRTRDRCSQELGPPENLSLPSPPMGEVSA
jgi:hypothetical protein